MLTEKYSCTASDRSIVIQEAKTAQERERRGRVFPARVLSLSLYISREDNLLSSAGALATAWWIIAIQLKANHTSNVITTVLFEGWTNRCHSVLTKLVDSLFTSLLHEHSLGSSRNLILLQERDEPRECLRMRLSVHAGERRHNNPVPWNKETESSDLLLARFHCITKISRKSTHRFISSGESNAIS